MNNKYFAIYFAATLTLLSANAFAGTNEHASENSVIGGDLGNETETKDGRPSSVAVVPCRLRQSWREFQADLGSRDGYAYFLATVKKVSPALFADIEAEGQKSIFCRSNASVKKVFPNLQPTADGSVRTVLFIPEVERGKNVLFIDDKRYLKPRKNGKGMTDEDRGSVIFRELLHALLKKQNLNDMYVQQEWKKRRIIQGIYSELQSPSPDRLETVLAALREYNLIDAAKMNEPETRTNLTCISGDGAHYVQFVFEGAPIKTRLLDNNGSRDVILKDSVVLVRYNGKGVFSQNNTHLMPQMSAKGQSPLVVATNPQNDFVLLDLERGGLELNIYGSGVTKIQNYNCLLNGIVLPGVAQQKASYPGKTYINLKTGWGYTMVDDVSLPIIEVKFEDRDHFRSIFPGEKTIREPMRPYWRSYFGTGEKLLGDEVMIRQEYDFANSMYPEDYEALVTDKNLDKDKSPNKGGL